MEGYRIKEEETMSTRFLDIFGLEHYHNLIMSKIGRRIYKKRVELTSMASFADLVFNPTGYTYDTGDENLIDVYLNGLRLDSTEYTASAMGSQILLSLTNMVDVGSGEDVVEMVLRK